MIKYLREKIIGHPAVFSRAGDIPIDDNISSMQRTNYQNSLNDIMSITTNSNDSTNTDRPISQVEKLIAAGGVGGINMVRRPVSSSSPIIIPKKPPRSNTSSQSSSSYTSVADQMSSLGESSIPNDDGVSIPTLPSACQQLEHSAARDRISVKNKRRQPIKQKLSTLRETDDNDIDLFSSKTEAISSTPEEEQSMFITTHVESKMPQPLVDLSDLDTVRARLRMSTRPRDRSADNILLTTNTNMNTNDILSNRPVIGPSSSSSHIQRSVSFKRPQEINENKLISRPIIKVKEKINTENDLSVIKPIEHKSPSIDKLSRKKIIDEHIESPSRSRSSSQEHIYDNLDVFKRTKINNNASSNEDEPSPTTHVKTRDHHIQSTRLRPLTMHISAAHDKQTANEFENVFNQFQKRGSVRKVRPNEEIIPEPSPLPETVAPPRPPSPVHTENEPIVPINKTIETSPIPQTPNRRKTVGGVYLPANNKVATNDNKPTPSWIEMAKQKQNKFQTVSNEKNHENDSEQQIPMEPTVTTRKQITSTDARSNRKSMFEQSTTLANTNLIERDSIRALKAGNPNRINNLIQFFDK
ncbi:unnamed protein product [Adineta steineri]|uniref:Uncharacterized protein n=1 Tax=Adineta steineri TaxID=433720 RepID=A0A815P9B9_9BILA|nr:unnamed protein product [Adineta steineri]